MSARDLMNLVGMVGGLAGIASLYLRLRDRRAPRLATRAYTLKNARHFPPVGQGKPVRHYSADDILRLPDVPRGNVFETPEHYWKRASLGLQATLVAAVLSGFIWPRASFLAWALVALTFLLFCIATARRDFVAARYVSEVTSAAVSRGAQ